jgi:hypothetical protein
MLGSFNLATSNGCDAPTGRASASRCAAAFAIPGSFGSGEGGSDQARDRAGTAMNPRLFYQYGLLLPAAPNGYVGRERHGAHRASRFVSDPIQEFGVDGVRLIFQNTSNAVNGVSRRTSAASPYSTTGAGVIVFTVLIDIAGGVSSALHVTELFLSRGWAAPSLAS